MITKKQYLEAKAIVTKYEEKVKKGYSVIRPKIKKGELVRTTKGCRFKGVFSGTVVGFCTWGGFPAVKVRKSVGNRIVVCLAKNLVRHDDKSEY